MPELNRPDIDNLQDVGFCLNQAFLWISRCWTLGAPEFRANDLEASRRMDLALQNQVATVAAHLNMTEQTAEFFLNLDDGPNGPLQILLFSQGFIPPEPLN